VCPMVPTRDDEPRLPRSVWRRDRSGSRPAIVEERPLMCGGPDYTAADRAEMRAAAAAEKRAKTEAEEREREAAARERAERRAARHRETRSDDFDDEGDGESSKKDQRYAVTLLQQEDTAWGRGGAGSGVLG